MAALILRIAARQGRAAEYRRFESGEVSVGRGFTNELIVPDPYLGARQFRILREDGGLWLEVLDRSNPLRVNGRVRVETRLPLAAGDEIDVGRSRFTVLREDTPVVPARRLADSRWERLGGWRPAVALLLLAATGVCAAWMDYLDSFSTPVWQDLLFSGLFMGALAIGWSAFWSVLARLVRHESQFWALLALSTALTLLTLFSAVSINYASYATGMDMAIAVADWILAGLLLFLLIRGSLQLATRIPLPSLAALLATIGPLGLLYALDQAGQDEFSAQPEPETLLMAPFAKRQPGLAFDDYDRELSALFEELSDRRE